MARIRTIKPEFFRHEGLQDCEAENPGSYVMLVFAGLWGHCDKAGRFEWRPRQLKLDILPFLNFDMVKTLTLLEKIGVLYRYEVDGEKYGCIPSLSEHQRFSGKEAQEPEKHPPPPVKQPGSDGEVLGKHLPAQEGNGIREGNRNGVGHSEADASGADAPLAVEPPKPIDLQKLVWDTGVEYLKAHGLKEKNARNLLGKWTKTHGPPATLDALRRAEVAASPNPVPYIEAVLKNGRSSGFTSVEDAFAGLEVRAATAVERESRAGWGQGGDVDASGDVWTGEKDAGRSGDLVSVMGGSASALRPQDFD